MRKIKEKYQAPTLYEAWEVKSQILERYPFIIYDTSVYIQESPNGEGFYIIVTRWNSAD